MMGIIKTIHQWLKPLQFLNSQAYRSRKLWHKKLTYLHWQASLESDINELI